jgi:hypothetical protein
MSVSKIAQRRSRFERRSSIKRVTMTAMMGLVRVAATIAQSLIVMFS